MDQSYQGVKVFGGEAILHMSGGEVREVTDALVRGIKLKPTPSISAPETLAAAHQALAPTGAYASAPTAELVFANIEREIPIRANRLGEVCTRTVSRMALVYHVHTELENGTQETRHTDYFVDAQSGEILARPRRWTPPSASSAPGTSTRM